MPGQTATALLVLVVAASSCRSAMAQQEVLDNIILLGPAETLNLPGVKRVVERPEEKAPPETFERTIEDDPFHLPLATRFHPGEAYGMEESGSRLRLRRGDSSRLGNASLSQGVATPGELPMRPAPLAEPSGAGSSRESLRVIGPRDLDDPGPPDGLTLDSAIVQLLRRNQDLRTKYHEIPQAEADILTAGLRGNPIIFWNAGGTPYGRFSNQPGTRNYPIVITYLLDFTGRRAARVRVAQTAKRVLDARYQDEVRRKIDELDTIFVEVLEARETAREARRSAAGAADPARPAGKPSSGRKPVVERTFVAIALRNAEDRLRGAKARPGRAARHAGHRRRVDRALRCSTRSDPRPAGRGASAHCASLPRRPGGSATERRPRPALERMEYSRRIRDTYILYQPWDYVIGQTNQGDAQCQHLGDRPVRPAAPVRPQPGEHPARSPRDLQDAVRLRRGGTPGRRRRARGVRGVPHHAAGSARARRSGPARRPPGAG